MIPMHVVFAGAGLDTAARREIAAIAQQVGQSDQAALRRETQQAARDAAQAQRDAARIERDAREATATVVRSLNTNRSQNEVVSEMPVAIPSGDQPRVTVNPDGRTTIVNPDGKTTVIEPNGRVTTINEDGRIMHSASASGENVIPNDVRELSMMALLLTAFVIVLRPLAGAFGRRLDRRGAVSGDQLRALQGEMGERMQRIEQAVEAVAIEVERVSEGQRFTTKLLSELKAPAALAASASQYAREK